VLSLAERPDAATKLSLLVEEGGGPCQGVVVDVGAEVDVVFFDPELELPV